MSKNKIAFYWNDGTNTVIENHDVIEEDCTNWMKKKNIPIFDTPEAHVFYNVDNIKFIKLYKE